MGEHRSGSTGRTLAIVLLTVGFVAGIWTLGPDDGPQDGVRKVLGMRPDRPLPVVEPPSGGGPHAFMQTTSAGEPIGFDPCRSVTVRVNPQGAPAGSDQLVDTATERLSRASGISLRRGPDTDQRPTLGSVGDLRTREEAPPEDGPEITVIWSGAEETPALARRTVGVGGSTAYAVGESRPYYLRGAVALDGATLGEALLRADGPPRVTAVVMHELAHALGLDHVRSDGELMNARSLGRLRLGPGDRTGLAQLGAVPCARR